MAQVDAAHLVKAVVGQALHRVGEAVPVDEDGGQAGAACFNDGLPHIAPHVEGVENVLRVGGGHGVHRGRRLCAVVGAGEGDGGLGQADGQVLPAVLQPEDFSPPGAQIGVGQGLHREGALVQNGQVQPQVPVDLLQNGPVGHIGPLELVVVVGQGVVPLGISQLVQHRPHVQKVYPLLLHGLGEGGDF